MAAVSELDALQKPRVMSASSTIHKYRYSTSGDEIAPPLPKSGLEYGVSNSRDHRVQALCAISRNAQVNHTRTLLVACGTRFAGHSAATGIDELETSLLHTCSTQQQSNNLISDRTIVSIRPCMVVVVSLHTACTKCAAHDATGNFANCKSRYISRN